MPVAKRCIFCSSQDNFESVEHIVPRSLGNLHYVLAKGTVCANCNNRFAHFENRVLSSHLFLQERKKHHLLRARNQVQSGELKAIDMQKFLLKMAYESFYKSKRKVWNHMEFTEILEFLLEGKNNPRFAVQPDSRNLTFKAIPGWVDRFRLSRNHLKLEYANVDERWYFRFQFGTLRSCIRIQ